LDDFENRYELLAFCRRLSVRPSVCPSLTDALQPNGARNGVSCY